jgi:hypothetical protein
MVIPHGLAWGTTNPSKADFRDQLQGYQARYEKLIETYSGHGSSEIFEDFQRVGRSENGGLYCPEATENFTPCCQQAGSIVRSRCADSTSAACAAEVDNVVAKFLAKGVPAGRDIVPDTSLNDWAGCGQLENQFQPASMYVPRNSTQYALALGFDAAGNPKQTRFGLIGSSDNHVARPGNSYKETNRILYTDNKDVGRTPMFQRGADSESGGFYYTGGLVAVHSQGRHRDAIWNGLNRRQVYATSGDRILVWFDLLNGPEGAAPMGSEVVQEQSPRFKVSALGALAQRPGCPDSALAALGADRIESLCGGQCYSPGNRRKAITRIEIVRIRPQLTPDEKIAPLVESPWRIHECPEGASECTYQFEDEEFLSGERPSLYYARVIQEAEPLISGDPFGCVYDEAGACVERNYCVGEYATATENCLHIAEPRAWTSPIYLNVPNAAGDH